MRRRSIGLIAAKELLDTLRDRRTLFIALVLPLLLYPALLFLVTGVIGATQRDLQEERQRVLFECGDGGRELALLLQENGLEPVDAASVDAGLRVRVIRDAGELAREETDAVRARLKAALKEQELAGALLCGEGFGDRIAGARQAEATLLFDSTDEASKVADGKVREALREFAEEKRDALRRRFPAEEDRLRFAEAPVRVTRAEVASKGQKGAYSFAPMLGLLIVVMALTGAFYPAVDLAAGEKERGTMETLLVAPVTRLEIVLGKFLAVWAIAVATALLNLLVMGLTFSKLAGMMPKAGISFSLPASAALSVTLILVPTAALFSGAALALSAFATSYKEGQHYLTPLFLATMPLAMVALLPNVEIGYALALVPVANVVLLVKTMLLGGQAVGPALVATAATAAYALLGLRAAVAVFGRESVLFRSGAGGGLDAKALFASRRGLPGEAQGLLLFFVVLALLFFLSARVETPAGAVRALVLAQAAVLLPTLALALRARLDVRATFSLRGLALSRVPIIAVAAAATLVAVLGLYARFPERAPEGLEKAIELLQGVPPWALFCLLAVLPPVCEELLCRGFLLSAFRTRFGDGRAVVLTALLFAALHLDLYRFPGTFAAGLVLGHLCVRTGSILAPVLFHMVYNGILASTMLVPGLGERLAAPGPWAVAAAAAVLAGALLLLRRGRFDKEALGLTLRGSARP